MQRSSRPYQMFIAATALALAAVVGGGSPSAMAATDAAFAGAFQQFSSASMGDTSSIDKAADSFDALSKAEPANPVLMAYAGATTAMKASTTMLPLKKMSYAEDGMALLD
jgi:hypothetical protein